MTEERPPLVGLYHLLSDFQAPTASIRIFRIRASEDAIQPHFHRRSMQIYVVLEGQVTIEIDGLERVLKRYQSLSVWPGAVHSARPTGPEAVLMNISVPPLGPDDQLGADSLQPETADMRMPGPDSDIDD